MSKHIVYHERHLLSSLIWKSRYIPILYCRLGQQRRRKENIPLNRYNTSSSWKNDADIREEKKRTFMDKWTGKTLVSTFGWRHAFCIGKAGKGRRKASKIWTAGQREDEHHHQIVMFSSHVSVVLHISLLHPHRRVLSNRKACSQKCLAFSFYSMEIIRQVSVE